MPRKLSLQGDNNAATRNKKRMASERYMTIVIIFLIGEKFIISFGTCGISLEICDFFE